MTAARRLLKALLVGLGALAAVGGSGWIARSEFVAHGAAVPTAPWFAGNPAPAASTARPASYSAELPPIPAGRVKEITLIGEPAIQEIAPGVKVDGWTFNGTIPGPVLHLRQGDVVHAKFLNRLPEPHTHDYHAAITPWNLSFRDILNGDSTAFDWTAEYPGVFMYHCVTDPPLLHVAQGLYGVMIVEPREGYPKADREFVLMRSEFYLKDRGDGIMRTDFAKAENQEPDYVVFNGSAMQYVREPLHARAGERVRFFLLNAGPNHEFDFHFVGNVIDRAYVDGNPKNVLYGLQTVGIPSSGGMIVEAIFPRPGKYPFVTHRFADEAKGAMGVLEVTP